MNRILKKLLVVILLSMAPAYCAFAQSASESYENGLALMKKKNYEAAIKCFKASMVINKSAANVKNCKAQIAKCEKAMKSKKSTPTAPPAPTVMKTLKLSTSYMPVDAEASAIQAVVVTTEPESNEWTAEIENSPQWVKMDRSDNKIIKLDFQPNEKTIPRKGTLVVRYGEDTKRVNITQKGVDVVLAAEKTEQKISKKKQETVNIKISCNSDTVYTNSYNWFIESYPDWCKAEQTSEQLTLTAEPIDKKSPLFKAGRQDDVILKSQDKKFIIRIIQK